jgi:corrinoid protein of di/trimethylamine methyltransferase
MSNRELLREISDEIVGYDAGKLVESVRRAMERGIQPNDIVLAMSSGMQVVGQRYEDKEYYLPDLLMAAEAMNSAMEVLGPTIATAGAASTGRVLVGTVEGDIHDIGKKIAVIFLKSAGFEVHDLGTDVPVERFVEEVKSLKPDILGMSGLMSTSLPVMEKVIELLKREGLRDGLKVMLGGSPVTDDFGRRVEADGVSIEALSGVRMMEMWMKNKS